MPELCQLLGITVNDLFNGEVVVMENYNENTEKLLIELAKESDIVVLRSPERMYVACGKLYENGLRGGGVED